MRGDQPQWRKPSQGIAISGLCPVADIVFLFGIVSMLLKIKVKVRSKFASSLLFKNPEYLCMHQFISSGCGALGESQVGHCN